MTLKRVLLVFGVVLTLTAVHAAAVTVFVNEDPVGELQTFTFQDGNLRVTTTAGPTEPPQPPTEPPPTEPPQPPTEPPQPPTEPPPTEPQCAGVDLANVNVIETPLMASSFNQVTVLPSPNDILAYKITTTPDTTVQFRTVITSSSRFAKLVSVSACRGDVKNEIESAIPDGRCWSLGTEGSSVRLTTNVDQQSFSCVLQANQTYYINVSSDLNRDPNDNSKSCTTTQNCSFKAEGNRL